MDGWYAAAARAPHTSGSSPDNNLGGAVGIMLNLQTPAQRLMQIPLSNQSGFNCGPVFQYSGTQCKRRLRSQRG